jgi:uncharacterized repeat protein (TIGR02543 family)
MKKIFLTSGVVLCLACPAFAADTKDLIPQDGGGYLLDGTQNAPNCSTPDTLTSATEATTFYAMWQAKSNLTVTYKPGSAGSTTVMAGNSAAGNQVTNATYDAPFTVYTNADLGSMPLANNAGSGTVLTKKGYEFAGWKPDLNIATGLAAASSLIYAESDNENITKYKVDGNVELTAQWTPLTYNVVYNKGSDTVSTGTNYTHENGMTFDVAYQALNFNSTPISGAMSANDGYTFCGWSTNSSDTCTNPNGTNSWKWTGTTLNNSVDQDVLNGYKTNGYNVYAIYSANTYNLTYTCGAYHDTEDGHSVHRTDSDYKTNYSSAAQHTIGYVYNEVGAAALDPDAVCALEGYHAIGWECEYVDDQNVHHDVNIAMFTRTSGDDEEPASAWEIPYNITCAATWEPNDITLHWVPGSNATGGGDGQCTYDLGITVPAAPTKPGYIFKGWSTTDPEAAGAGEDEVTGDGPDLG